MHTIYSKMVTSLRSELLIKKREHFEVAQVNMFTDRLTLCMLPVTTLSDFFSFNCQCLSIHLSRLIIHLHVLMFANRYKVLNTDMYHPDCIVYIPVNHNGGFGFKVID